MHASLLAVPLAVLSLGLAACGGDEKSGNDSGSRYPSQVEKTFLQACETSSKGKTAACRCALDKLEATVPYEDFKKADEAIRKGGRAEKATTAKISAAIKACA